MKIGGPWGEFLQPESATSEGEGAVLSLHKS